MDILFTVIAALCSTLESEAVRQMRKIAEAIEFDGNAADAPYHCPVLWQFVDMDLLMWENPTATKHTPLEDYFMSLGRAYDLAHDENKVREHFMRQHEMELAEDMALEYEPTPSHGRHEVEPINWEYVMATRNESIRKGVLPPKRNRGRKIKSLRTHRV